MELLEIKCLSKNFGGLKAVNNLDFEVNESEILGLIGPNGAGKTTVFNVISGFYPDSRGKIWFQGQDIRGMKPYKIAQLGIGRTFQASILFMDSSVVENVFIGFHIRYLGGLWKSFMHTPSARREEKWARQEAMSILEFMGLSDLRDERAKNLPHGHQRLLGISMAMAARPKLLLLDEPAGGMNPDETTHLVNLIKKIRDAGTTIVLVEHDMQAVMKACDRIVVLNYGEKIAEGIPQEITTNEAVIEAYLGREE